MEVALIAGKQQFGRLQKSDTPQKPFFIANQNYFFKILHHFYINMISFN